MTLTLTNTSGDSLPGISVFFIPPGSLLPGPEVGDSCLESSDSDGDGKVNDGCPPLGWVSETESNQCDNSVSDDFFDDDVINDGCPGFGATTGIALPEGGIQCDNDANDDPRDDAVAGVQRVNDGCPAVDAAEAACDDNVDDDADTYVNDGCYPGGVGGPEPEVNECDNATDDDFDGYINDGCVFPPGAIGGPALGAIIGEAQVNFTLGTGGLSPVCGTQLPILLPLMNASVDNRLQSESSALPQGSVGPEGPLEPFRDDVDGNGLPRHVDRYPRFVNQLLDPDRTGDIDGDGDEVDTVNGVEENPGSGLFDPYGTLQPVRPLARYSGSILVAGEAWMLQMLVFAPGAFSVFEPPHPLSDLGSAGLGYPTLVLFNDPVDDYGPSPVQDICSPSTTEMVLWGKTRDNPCTVLTATPCTTDGLVNLPPYDRNDSSGPCDSIAEGYDEAGCVRYANPATAGTYHFYVYQQSQRDTDADGYENGLDSCPYQTNVEDPRQSAGPDGDMLDSACDPTPTTNIGNGNHDGDSLGGFAWQNAQDNCPTVVNSDQKESESTALWTAAAPRGGSRTDQVGDVCDNNDTRADGQFHTVFEDIPKCIGGTDQDGDGWCATGGAGQPNDPDDTKASKTPEEYSAFVPLPLTHAGSGVNATVGGTVWAGFGLDFNESSIADDGIPPHAYYGAGQPYQLCNDGVDNDGDTLTDLLDPGCEPAGLPVHPGYPACPEDGCAGIDSDGDGYTDEAEIHIGTDPFGRCEVGAVPNRSTDWPSDLRSDAGSADKIDIFDLSTFAAPVRRLDTYPGHPDFDPRWDLAPGDSGLSDWINIVDQSAMTAPEAPSGGPPMFQGVRAYNGPPCTAHPLYGD